MDKVGEHFKLATAQKFKVFVEYTQRATVLPSCLKWVTLCKLSCVLLHMVNHREPICMHPYSKCTHC